MRVNIAQKVTAAPKGAKTFRVYHSADTDHLVGVSPNLTLTVG